MRADGQDEYKWEPEPGEKPVAEPKPNPVVEKAKTDAAAEQAEFGAVFNDNGPGDAEGPETPASQAAPVVAAKSISFKDALDQAKADGKETFEWNDKKYSAGLEDRPAAKPAAKPAPKPITKAATVAKAPVAPVPAPAEKPRGLALPAADPAPASKKNDLNDPVYVGNAIKGAVKSAASAVSSMASSAKSAAQPMVEPVDGINDPVKVGNAIKGAVGSAIGAVKRFGKSMTEPIDGINGTKSKP